MSDNCIESPWSSRVCERGTKGCKVRHDPQDPVAALTQVLRECEMVPVIWLCPNGCQGRVVWTPDKGDAQCQVCGCRRSGN